jgi:hypothetical protein
LLALRAKVLAGFGELVLVFFQTGLRRLGVVIHRGTKRIQVIQTAAEIFVGLGVAGQRQEQTKKRPQYEINCVS